MFLTLSCACTLVLRSNIIQNYYPAPFVHPLRRRWLQICQVDTAGAGFSRVHTGSPFQNQIYDGIAWLSCQGRVNADGKFHNGEIIVFFTHNTRNPKTTKEVSHSPQTRPSSFLSVKRTLLTNPKLKTSFHHLKNQCS